MREEVLRAAKREGIAERLIVAGVTNDILSAMSIMDVFLLASFGEGLPNVLLEAQWVGTPVVVTDVGGAKEAVEPGITGWPIATNSAAELAARIKWLHDNPTVLKAARVEARNGSGSSSASSVWSPKLSRPTRFRGLIAVRPGRSGSPPACIRSERAAELVAYAAVRA